MATRRSSLGAISRLASGSCLATDPLRQYGYVTLGPIASGAFSMVQRARHAEQGVEGAVKTYSKGKCTRLPHFASAMRS